MPDYNRFAILIASSEFPEEPKLPPLRCPLNDVEGLRKILESPKHGEFKKVEVLKNNFSHKVLLTINKVLMQARKEDLVLIYYSGHGKPDKANRLHLATCDTQVDVLESTSIPVQRIKDMMDNSPSTKIVLILDCCFSGAVEKIFSKGSIDDQFQLLSQGRGKYILTASTDIQTAQEKEGEEYSVYTKHLIHGIWEGEADRDFDGFITMDELYAYVHNQVLAETSQEPMRWFNNVAGELKISKSGKRTIEDRIIVIKDLLEGLIEKEELPKSLLAPALTVLTSQQVGPLREQNMLLDSLEKKELTAHQFLVKWFDAEPTKPSSITPITPSPMDFTVAEEPEKAMEMASAVIDLAGNLEEKGKLRQARIKYNFARSLLEQLRKQGTSIGHDFEYIVSSKMRNLDSRISSDKKGNGEYLASHIELCEQMLEKGQYEEAESSFKSTIDQLEKEVSDISCPATMIPFLEKLADKSSEKKVDKEYDKAIEYLEFRLDLPENKSEASIKGRIRALQGIGEVMLGKGDYARIDDDYEMAVHWYKLSLEFFEWLGDHQNLSATYTKLGELAEEQNRLEEHASYIQKSEEHSKFSTPLKKRWPSFALKIVGVDFVVQDGALIQDKVRVTFQNFGKLTWRKGRRIRFYVEWEGIRCSISASHAYWESIFDQNVAPLNTVVVDVPKEFPSFGGQWRVVARVQRTPWQRSDDLVSSGKILEESENQPSKLVG